MVLNKLLSARRPVALITLLSFLLLTFDAFALPRAQQDIPIRVSNPDWKLEGNLVSVMFDLVGPTEKIYSVSLVLLREGDPRFRLAPKSVSGNIGDGVTAGSGRKIVWEYKRDVPQGLAGEGYYFEIVARLESAGGGGWLYYLLGGVVAAGGAAGYLLSNKPKTEPGSVGSTELPGPPARPNQ